MKLRTFSSLSLAAAVLIGLSGCQSGKINMPGMAFWKKNDRLSPELIEPPSHNFTPGDMDIAASDVDDAVDIEGGPPLRPDNTVENNESVESFAAEVNRSWEQLAEQSAPASDQHAESVQQATVDVANVSMPPTRGINGGAFSSPLTPRDVATTVAESTGSPMDSGGFQPVPNETPAPTRYEQLAQNSFEAEPSAMNPNPINSATPDPTVSGTPLVAQTEPIPSGTGEAVRMRNPYSTQTQPPELAQTGDAAGGSDGDTGPNYESTPYPSFQPRNQPAQASPADLDQPGIAPNAASNQLAEARQNDIPAVLKLSGQGSYSPGSVRRPDPIQPESLEIPHTAGGGNFQR